EVPRDQNLPILLHGEGVDRTILVCGTDKRRFQAARPVLVENGHGGFRGQQQRVAAAWIREEDLERFIAFRQPIAVHENIDVPGTFARGKGEQRMLRLEVFFRQGGARPGEKLDRGCLVDIAATRYLDSQGAAFLRDGCVRLEGESSVRN